MRFNLLQDSFASFVDETYFVFCFVNDKNTLLKIVEQFVITSPQNFRFQVDLANPRNTNVYSPTSNELPKTPREEWLDLYFVDSLLVNEEMYENL